MKLKPFTLPEKLDLDSATATDSYGRFTLAPLEKGWGATVGNSLRRALLSSVQGAAITELRIDGVAHGCLGPRGRDRGAPAEPGGRQGYSV